MSDPRDDALLSAWIDGELPASESAALRARLEREPALAARLSRLRESDARLRALPAPPVRPSLRDDLQARLDAEGDRQGEPVRLDDRRPLRWALPAAAALAVGLVVYLGLRPAPPEELVRAPGPVAPEPAAPESSGAAEPADEADLAIALDYDLLRDFELIDQLELLEVLAAYEDARGGRS